MSIDDLLRLERLASRRLTRRDLLGTAAKGGAGFAAAALLAACGGLGAESSPTEAATRFTAPERASPAAKTPGMLVSNGTGDRPMSSQATPRSVLSRSRSVQMEPSGSSATSVSQPVAGSALMRQNKPSQPKSSETPVEEVTMTPRNAPSPRSAVHVVSVCTRIA